MYDHSARVATEVDVIVGQNIRHIRLLQGLTQQDLAEEVGIRAQQLQKYETGKDRVSASRLLMVSQVFGVSVEDLYDGAINKSKTVSPFEKTKEVAKAVRLLVKMTEDKQKSALSMLRALAK